MATPQQIETVGAFVGRLLVGLAFEKKLAVGFGDLPVLTAIKDISPVEYKLALAAMLRQPDVKAALALIESLQPPDEVKPADATVRSG